MATLLAIVVWLCTPKEYTALVKVSDEYKETDIAIGLTSMKAHIRNLMDRGNSGINNMATYSKIILTEDFARNIAGKQIPGRQTTYGNYLGERDTVNAVLEHINYNHNTRQETLTISFTDRDPLIAAQMLDSVTALLQDMVTSHRRQIAEAVRQDAAQELRKAEEEYKKAEERYASFADSHADTGTQSEKKTEEALKNEVTLAYKHFEEVTNKYARQSAISQRSYLSFSVARNNTVPARPRGTFMGYWLSFLLIALALTHVARCYRSGRVRPSLDWGGAFAPWTLSILIWAMILGLYYLLDTSLYPIRSQFYDCLILWLPIFCVCSLTAYHLEPVSQTGHAIGSDFHVNKRLFNFFFVITAFMTPLYLYRVLNIVMMFGSEDLMNNMRTLAIYGEGQGILNYSNVINQALFVVALWAYPKIPKWQIAVLALACLTNSLAIMEKGTIFFVFLCFVLVLYEKKHIRARTIAVSGISLVLVFYLFNLARAGEDSDYQKEETLLDFFTMYALSPPVAFCQLLREVTPQFGANTFETVYLLMARLGFSDIVVKEKLQEFVFVPISTNVYTIFQPFYVDFGYKGVALFAGLYGSVCGWLYRLYKNGNSTACCLYTYMVFALVLQFYQENVFLSMVFVLQFIFFVFLFTQRIFRTSPTPMKA